MYYNNNNRFISIISYCYYMYMDNVIFKLLSVSLLFLLFYFISVLLKWFCCKQIQCILHHNLDLPRCHSIPVGSGRTKDTTLR